MTMNTNRGKTGFLMTAMIMVLVISTGYRSFGQISPGPLASAHSHLEGLSNCTQCHSLGDKVSNAKCLGCHTELKTRIDQNKGYHVSAEVRGKNCVACHSDHHGVNFQIVRFAKEKFNHDLSGFKLTGAHAKKACNDCHKKEFIVSKTIKNKKFTYLGLSADCTPCHADYHRKTLSSTCTSCHTTEAFKPAANFDHARSQFPLAGMHRSVECVKCHPVTVENGVKFQAFAGIKYNSCSNCHNDPHKNQFGPNCRQCHSEESFRTIKGISNFDHSKTAFPLVDRHKSVACKSCHKTNLTDPIKHSQCTDCHSDYHIGQFTAQGVNRNCADCHTTKGFAGSTFTVEQHNAGQFVLREAHLATPCFACHKKTETWNFRNVGTSCSDCHPNIHETRISDKYLAGAGCSNCHNEIRWSNISFDHASTGYPLNGAHATQSCRRCHFKPDDSGRDIQTFAGLSFNCVNCHADIHYGQFESGGGTDCRRCHQSDQWKLSNFDHSKTLFRLDGKHSTVPCQKCHKTITSNGNSYVLYKLKETKCENCH